MVIPAFFLEIYPFNPRHIPKMNRINNLVNGSTILGLEFSQNLVILRSSTEDGPQSTIF